MIKNILVVALLGSCLFGAVKYKTPSINAEYKFNVNDEVVINCETEEYGGYFGFFKDIGFKEIQEDLRGRAIDRFYSSLCKNRINRMHKQYDLKIRDLINTLIAENILIIDVSTYLPEKIIKNEITIDRYTRTSLEVSYESVTGYTESIWFPYSKFHKGAAIEITKKNSEGEDSVAESLGSLIIKDYNYNKTNREIDKFTFENKITYKKDMYTNTYPIDSMIECIEGQTWVIKYGAMNGRDCPWTHIDQLDK